MTRREAVALLYSFGTNYLGLELTERADLTPYEDAAAVASWGGEAVAWAVARPAVQLERGPDAPQPGRERHPGPGGGHAAKLAEKYL